MKRIENINHGTFSSQVLFEDEERRQREERQMAAMPNRIESLGNLVNDFNSALTRIEQEKTGSLGVSTSSQTAKSFSARRKESIYLKLKALKNSITLLQEKFSNDGKAQYARRRLREIRTEAFVTLKMPQFNEPGEDAPDSTKELYESWLALGEEIKKLKKRFDILFGVDKLREEINSLDSTLKIRHEDSCLGE